jgi:hypothetical protein
VLYDEQKAVQADSGQHHEQAPDRRFTGSGRVTIALKGLG